ncbi:MAG TPA: hydroxymethylbilane synthase [Longimicrobiales bacterium]|nr:hydroxymethylbilane synthase [Longimicrobiales bacterium]
MKLRLGSRGSTLALWQANHVQARLRSLHPGLDVEIDVLHTTGDLITDVPLAMIGDKGLFTKEVDGAVLDGRVDLAVHSFKDVPTRLPDGLVLAAVMEREDPRDAFLPAPGRTAALGELPAGARVGTSSLRRRAILLSQRPDIVVEDLRGNLDTRLRKLDEGRYDGIILALAGLRRFGREDAVGETLDPPFWLPAAGQGALAIVTRDGDTETLERVRALDHPATRAATAAERAFLAHLEGGCQIPIGALADARGDTLRLQGLVASLDGATIIRGEHAGGADGAVAVGEHLARRLVDDGADAVLREVRAVSPRGVPDSGAR